MKTFLNILSHGFLWLLAVLPYAWVVRIGYAMAAIAPTFSKSRVKVINANLYKVEEVQEIFKRISAPTLCVIASDNSLDTWWKGKYTLNEFQERMKAVAQLQNALVQDAGHMMHHDQPQVLAELMEAFLDAPDA
mgnify:CR=1 FL=1